VAGLNSVKIILNGLNICEFYRNTENSFNNITLFLKYIGLKLVFGVMSCLKCRPI
jgi:hypothetical protein